MPVPVRGLHLYSSSWAYPDEPNLQRDLGLINKIGNLNSIKTTLFTYRALDDNGRKLWNARQMEKITAIRSCPSLSGDQTFVFRCWPVPEADINQYGGNWYQAGFDFAQNLVHAFSQIRDLGIQHAYLEVANEPNLPEEPFGQSMAAYNDFFRGFFWGERAIGFDFPLVYAGLSPSNADAWYQDYWVQAHIRDYAAKVGVHVYWEDGRRGEESPIGGKYYRTVRLLLEAGGVPPKGLFITEFNARRDTYPGATDDEKAEAQINDVCLWWQEEYNDALNGWWCEQAMLYVTKDDDAWRDSVYGVRDVQLDNITNA